MGKYYWRADYQCRTSSSRNSYVLKAVSTREDIVFFFNVAADATCQFTLILTGVETGLVKIDVPFKLDGVDDYGYLRVEAEIIVR